MWKLKIFFSCKLRNKNLDNNETDLSVVVKAIVSEYYGFLCILRLLYLQFLVYVTHSC